MQTEKHLNEQNLLQICQYIKNASRIDTGIDDNILATNKVFSNVKVTNLLLDLEIALKNYTSNMFSKITHLIKEVVTTLDASTANDYTLYLLKKTDTNGNEYFEQYLFDIKSQTFNMIGTTKVNDTGSVTFYTDNTDYYVNDIVLYKPISDIYYSMYVCKKSHNSGTSFIDDNWEIVDEKQELMIVSDIQPSNNNTIWIDTTYPNKPIIKIHNGTNWVEASGNSIGIINKTLSNIVANTPVSFNAGINLGDSFLIDVYTVSTGLIVLNTVLKSINNANKNTLINNEKEVNIDDNGTGILDEENIPIVIDTTNYLYKTILINGYKDISEIEVI